MKSKIIPTLFMLLLAVSIAQAQSVSRNLPDGDVTAGTSFAVDIAVSVAAGTTYYAIDETIPTSWAVASVTGGGDYTSQAGHVKWAVVENATSTTYSYTVNVPLSANGQFTFGPGEYQFENQQNPTAIGGDSSVQVIPPTQPDFTLTTSPTSVAIPRNSSRTVTIDIGQIAGYNQVVTLSALGVPNGTTPSFSPTSGSPAFTSTLTLAAGAAAPLGASNIIIRGVGADNKQHNVTLQMNITIPPVCGNGVKEAGEDCDGSALGGATCSSASVSGSTGNLSCTGSCTFNTSACVAPTAQPTCSVQKDLATCTLASASDDQTIEWELGQPSKLGITGVEVTTSASASNIQLTLQRLPGKPATAPDLPPAVYQYYTISENNLPNSKIASATISFAVNKSWLSANNVQAGSVKLNRLANNTWSALATAKTSEDTNFAYFEANSPAGLSVFGVNGVVTLPQCPSSCPQDSIGTCEPQADGSGKQNVTTYTCGPQTDFKCVAQSTIQGCCLTCPQPGAFGACSAQGQQTRTVYSCSAQTDFKCVQSTGSQACVSQELASGFISQAQSDIRTADSQGKDVTAAQDLLAQAQAALTAGNYDQAKSLAQQASQAAHIATPRPFPIPPAVLIAILVIVAVVIIAIVLKKKGVGRGPAKNRCYIGGEETVLGLKCTVCMQRICIRHARAHGGRIYCERHVPKA